jgi:hypothetical protein
VLYSSSINSRYEADSGSGDIQDGLNEGDGDEKREPDKVAGKVMSPGQGEMGASAPHSLVLQPAVSEWTPSDEELQVSVQTRPSRLPLHWVQTRSGTSNAVLPRHFDLVPDCLATVTSVRVAFLFQFTFEFRFGTLLCVLTSCDFLTGYTCYCYCLVSLAITYCIYIIHDKSLN